jgi:NAD(P)-dependent dehydrogenase (short-subunit alcohol dehydrogenase family)
VVTVRRRAIVTGANSGIGKAIALGFAREGYDVGITWYGDEAGASREIGEAAAAGAKVVARYLDLAEPAAAAQVIAELSDALGGLDAFVNNAGTGGSDRVLDLSLDAWRHVLDVNLNGAFVCLQAAARRMVADGTHGRVVVITSIQADMPRSGSAAYGASKAGLTMLVRTMALELGRYGICVNAVAPGETATAMSGMEGVDPTTVHRPNVPIGRPGSPDEVAALVLWLASEESSFVTGASVPVDGGSSLMAAELTGLPPQLPDQKKGGGR